MNSPQIPGGGRPAPVYGSDAFPGGPRRGMPQPMPRPLQTAYPQPTQVPMPVRPAVRPQPTYSGMTPGYGGQR